MESSSNSSGTNPLFPTAGSSYPEVFVFLMVSQCTLSLVAAASLVRRRRKFPFNGRESALLWSMLLSLTTNGLGTAVETVWTITDCIYQAVTENITVLLTLNAAAVRLVRLWFLYFAAHEKLDRKYDRSDSTWFQDRRHWASRRYLLGTLVSVTLLEAIVILTPYFAGDGWRTQTGGTSSGECGLNTADLIIALQCSVIIVYAWSGWKIRNIRDGFHIKDEMKYVGVVALATTVVTPFFHETFGTGFRIFRLLVCILTQMVIAIIFHYPLYLSIRFEREQKRVLSSGQGTQRKQQGTQRKQNVVSTATATTLKSTSETPLYEVLTEDRFKQDRSHFEAHLCKEFSLENLLFWERTKAFESLAHSETITYELFVREAIDVYSTFVRAGSPLETNLSAKSAIGIVKDLREAVVNFDSVVAAPDTKLELASDTLVTDTLFERAQEGVYRLMSRDSYVRWHNERRIERDRLAKQNQRPPLQGRAEVELATQDGEDVKSPDDAPRKQSNKLSSSSDAPRAPSNDTTSSRGQSGETASSDDDDIVLSEEIRSSDVRTSSSVELASV